MEGIVERATPRVSGGWLAFLRILMGFVLIYQAAIGQGMAWVPGILLVLGLFTPIGALWGFALAIAVSMHQSPAPAGVHPYVWAWDRGPITYWAFEISMLTLAFTRAGRALGVDHWLARRWKGSPAW